MQINRLENTVDRNGNAEVFCEVIFNSDTYGMINFGHWLTPNEMAAYTADNDAITTIMQAYQVTAELQKAQELSN